MPLPLNYYRVRRVPAMHQVLEIRELVDEILSSLLVADLAKTIRVNKYFFQASKRLLWKNIQLNRALDLLGTTKLPGSCDSCRISNAPTHEAWKRFFEYTRDVRKLIGFTWDAFPLWDAIRFLPDSCQGLDVDTLDYFFPGCRILEWYGADELKFGVIDRLISPNLECFLIQEWDLGPEFQWFHHISDTLTTRLSSLSVFHLDIHLPPTESDDEPSPNLDPYLNLLTTFARSLTSVALPGALVTAETFERLSQIKNLSRVETYYEGTSPFYEVVRDGFTIQNGNTLEEFSSLNHGFTIQNGNALEEFSSLNHVGFSAEALPMTVSNFFSKFSFSSLRTLRWTMSQVPRGIIFDLLATIANKCPELEFLELGEIKMDRVPFIPWSCLRPILEQCSKLAYLKLRCCQVKMTFDNYTELVRSRQGPTAWRVLQVFTSEPFHLPEILSLFARYSPGVQALGFNVYLNDDIGPFEFTQPFQIPSDDKLPIIPDLWLYLQTRFQFSKSAQQSEMLLPLLTIIDVSTSLSTGIPVKSAVKVAALLLALCKNPVYVIGWEIEFITQVYACTANYYTDLQKRIDKPMSPEVQKYVDYQLWIERGGFDPMGDFIMFEFIFSFMNVGGHWLSE